MNIQDFGIRLTRDLFLFTYLIEFAVFFFLQTSIWNSRYIIRDFACPDTLAASHLNPALYNPSEVANDAENLKMMKYRSLVAPYLAFYWR